MSAPARQRHRSRSRRRWLAGGCLALVWGAGATGAWAQSGTDSLRSTTLDSVRIRPAAAGTTLARVQAYPWLGPASLQPGTSLAETIRLLPGVQVDDRRNPSQGDRIALRGIGARAQFGVRGIRIDWDGIPLTFADGQSQLNLVDVALLDAVTVEHTAQAFLYGNAAGGRIALTSRAVDAGWAADARVQWGSFGLQRQLVRLAYGGRGRYWAAVSRTRQSGYRPHSQARWGQVLGGADWLLGPRTHLAARIAYYDAPYLLNPSSLAWADVQADRRQTRSFVQRQGAGKWVQQGLGAGLLTHLTPAGARWQLSGYGGWRELFNPIPGAVIRLPRVAGGGRAAWHSAPRRWQWHAAAEADFLTDRRREWVNDGIPAGQTPAPWDVLSAVQTGDLLVNQRETVLRGSLAAQLRAHWGADSAWTAEAGLRADGYRYTATERRPGVAAPADGSRRIGRISPQMRLRWRYDGRHDITLATAAAVVPPTTTELSNRPDAAGGFNPALQPERLWTVELGSDRTWRQGSAFVRTYAYWLRNGLVPFQIPGPDDVTFYRNAARSRYLGVELGGAWQPSRFWQLRGQMSYADARFTDYRPVTNGVAADNSGKRIPGYAPLQGTLAVWYGLPQQGLQAQLWLQHAGATWANDANAAAPGQLQAAAQTAATTRTDLRLGWSGRLSPLVRWTAFAGADNLWAAPQYTLVPNAAGGRYFEPLPGRTWYAGLHLHWGR